MRRLSLALLATTLLATGCGPETELDLDLRAVSITVPRLATPAVEIVPEAPLPPAVPLPGLPPIVLPPPFVAPTAAAPPPTAPSAAPVACPRAGQLEAPARAGTPLIPGPPASGRYTQTATGEFTTPDGEGLLAGTVDVTVTALPTATSGAGQRVDAWEVTRTDESSGTSVERYQLVHPSDSPAATAPGIYLVGLAWDDEVRGELRFEPVGGGLQVLPNPVVLATTDPQYVGVATDPATLTTLSITRNVTGTKRIDLCGDLVDAYTVEMSGTLTSSDSQYSVAWTQQLASAYGAANVEEQLTLTSADAGVSYGRELRSTSLPKEVA